VCSGFGSSGFADHFITLRARWEQFGCVTQSLRLFGKPRFKGLGLTETASLHGVAPSFSWRRERTGAN
jgi:hypothetical protein